MVTLSTADGLSSSLIRSALLVAGLLTYFISADDVVWHFINAASHARVLEHILFGIAATTLGIALLLKVKISADEQEQSDQDGVRDKAAVANLLQAVGIGSLLPLPGFLVLVLGDFGVSILLHRRRRAYHHDAAAARQVPWQMIRWRDALVAHLGLCCAFISMVVFSIVLVDRVADVLFAATGLISITAAARHFLCLPASQC